MSTTTADLLERRDAEITRCRRCGEWRWRATYKRCQACGAGPQPLSGDRA